MKVVNAKNAIHTTIFDKKKNLYKNNLDAEFSVFICKYSFIPLNYYYLLEKILTL